jgi:hypothetical protein
MYNGGSGCHPEGLGHLGKSCLSSGGADKHHCAVHHGTAQLAHPPSFRNCSDAIPPIDFTSQKEQMRSLSLVSYSLVLYLVVTTDAPTPLATIFNSRFNGRSIGIGTALSASVLAPFTDIGIGSQQNNVRRTQNQRG